MTTAELPELVRRLSRQSALTADDATVLQAINSAKQQFVQDTGGMRKDTVLLLEAVYHLPAGSSLSVGTDSVAQTDVVVAASDQSFVSGASLQALLEAALQSVDPGFVVTYDVVNFMFQISYPGATSITIDNVETGYQIAPMIFGYAPAEQSGAVWNGARGEKLDVVSPMPDDFHQVATMQCDDYYEMQAYDLDWIKAQDTEGRPRFYAVQDDRYMYYYPNPESVDYYLVMSYYYEPLDLTDSDTETLDLPDEHYYTIAYHAASSLAEQNHDFDVSDRYWIRYERGKNRFIKDMANDNRKIAFYNKTLFRDRFDKLANGRLS
jgi:hypothetical protein